MRHIISILLANEAGALSRVAGLFSARGYNIESLTVAPTQDSSVSRLTMVTTGSDEVIEQINKQLRKLVDVVDLADMTQGEHIERDLLLLKLEIEESQRATADALVSRYGGQVLDDSADSYTVEFTGTGRELDDFIAAIATGATVLELVRTGVGAIACGQQILRFDG